MARRDWVSIDVSGPVPLLEMYRDILSQHGIPSVITDAGVGPGALGGVPGFGALRVTSSDAGTARALLREETDVDDSESAPRMPGKRRKDRGSR